MFISLENKFQCEQFVEYDEYNKKSRKSLHETHSLLALLEFFKKVIQYYKEFANKFVASEYVALKSCSRCSSKYFSLTFGSLVPIKRNKKIFFGRSELVTKLIKLKKENGKREKRIRKEGRKGNNC